MSSGRIIATFESPLRRKFLSWAGLICGLVIAAKIPMWPGFLGRNDFVSCYSLWTLVTEGWIDWNGMLLFALPTTLASVAICLCIGRAVDRRLEDREIERRAILNLCYFCAYPLTGSTSGICPECGSAVNMSEHGASCQHQRGSYGTS